jgi:hypothetical protein
MDENNEWFNLKEIYDGVWIISDKQVLILI